MHSPTLIYFSGLLSLSRGIAMLNVHRAWTSDWRVIITILGWLLVIGGIIRIVLPQTTAVLGERHLATVGRDADRSAIIVLIIGGLLSFRRLSPGKKEGA